MTFQREFGESLYWPTLTAAALTETLHTCAFFCIWISRRLCFPRDLKMWLKPCWSSTSLSGQDKVTAPLGVTRRGCSCCRWGRDGESLDPAPSCCPVPWRILKRGVCADSNARWVFVLRPRVGHREEQLCTASDPHSLSQSSLATAVTFTEREERFCFSPCKFGNKLSILKGFERLCFAGAVQAFST